MNHDADMDGGCLPADTASVIAESSQMENTVGIKQINSDRIIS
jgi:hypothetical protein